MKTTADKPTTTASATPDKVRTSQQLANARKHLPDIDATLEAMRTIPAEKPTDWKTFDKIEQLKLDLRTAKRDLKYWMREALEQTEKCDKLEAELEGWKAQSL